MRRRKELYPPFPPLSGAFRRFPPLGLFFAAAILANGCTVGPNYKRPVAPVPPRWDLAEPWRESAPKDALPKGQWWSVFHDDELNAFEKDALEANQTIKISIARLEQARATAAIQVSTLFPTASTAPGVQRQRLSGNRPTNGVPVTLQLSSQDVQHGFYIRGLKVDEEIQPGKTTEVTITPDKAGTFPTICDHFCGLGHKDMNMTIVVEE